MRASVRSLTVTGANSAAGSPCSSRGRKRRSHAAYSGARKTRRMHSASISAGERKSSPLGSHA